MKRGYLIGFLDQRLLKGWKGKRKEEYKGMQILLDYSLINDLTKDSVSQNIEKLFK